MRPETRALYPDNWADISRACLDRANHTCQDCARTDLNDGVVLTSHHRDYDPSHNVDDNLVCLCQGCHLKRQAHDLSEAIKYFKRAWALRWGQLVLAGFELEMPKIPARVLAGKALATRARYGQYAPPDTSPAG